MDAEGGPADKVPGFLREKTKPLFGVGQVIGHTLILINCAQNLNCANCRRKYRLTRIVSREPGGSGRQETRIPPLAKLVFGMTARTTQNYDPRSTIRDSRFAIDDLRSDLRVILLLKGEKCKKKGRKPRRQESGGRRQGNLNASRQASGGRKGRRTQGRET